MAKIVSIGLFIAKDEMADIYRQIFDFKEGKLTTLVMNQLDFNQLIDTIEGLDLDLKESDIDQLKTTGHLPLIARGSKTQPVFEKYAVETEYLAAIIKGVGEKLFEEINESDRPNGTMDLESTFAEEYQGAIADALPPEAQTTINKRVDEIMTALHNGQAIDQLIFFLHKRYAEGLPRSFINLLNQQTVDSIGSTLAMMAGMGIQDTERFKNYLRRLLSHNLLNIDILKLEKMPNYITSNHQITERLDKALRSNPNPLASTYAEWVETANASVRNVKKNL